jgi:hypothetical protein
MTEPKIRSAQIVGFGPEVLAEALKKKEKPAPEKGAVVVLDNPRIPTEDSLPLENLQSGNSAPVLKGVLFHDFSDVFLGEIRQIDIGKNTLLLKLDNSKTLDEYYKQGLNDGFDQVYLEDDKGGNYVLKGKGIGHIDYGIDHTKAKIVEGDKTYYLKAVKADNEDNTPAEVKEDSLTKGIFAGGAALLGGGTGCVVFGSISAMFPSGNPIIRGVETGLALVSCTAAVTSVPLGIGVVVYEEHKKGKNLD